jgi:hypothetical protein
MDGLDPRSWKFSPPLWLARFAGWMLIRLERNMDPESQVDSSQNVLASVQRRWGVDSRPAVNTMEGVSHRLDRAGRTDEALILHMNAFSKRSTTQGPDHPDALRSERCVAKMLAAASRHDEALTHFEHIVNAQSETSGTDRVSYLIDMQWLADSISRANRRTEASALLTRVVVGLRAEIGPDDERTMNATTALARVLAMDGEFERALSIQRPVLETRARTQGVDHPDTVRALWNLAAWTHWARKEADARVLALNLVEKQRRLLGEDHPHTKAAETLLGAIDATTSD